MFMHTFLLVFVAEMADKTQLMMMALTNRYRVRSVAIGMSIGVFLISILSVLAGGLIKDFIPMYLIQLVAACLFLVFGLSSLLPEKIQNHHQKSKQSRFPVMAIAFAFLLAELGDKTQLATVAIAAHHPEHIMIFLGASAGLILANFLGIFAGKLVFSHLSENTVKVASAGFFFLFGSFNLWQCIPASKSLIIIYSILLMFTAYLVYTIPRKVIR